MIDKEFVLTRERVEWLLKPFPTYYVDWASQQDNKRFITPKLYDEAKIEWLVGRELLYCEYTKDYKKIDYENISFHEVENIKKKWKDLGLSIYGIMDLVVRLEESRG